MSEQDREDTADSVDPLDELDDVEVESDPFTDLGEVTPDDDPFEDLSTETPDEADLSTLLEGPPEEEDDGLIAPALDEDIEVVNGEAVVPKRRYCEQCEHFSAPPDATCTYEGSEVRELVDMNHFRVYRCPVVARRLGLRGYDD
ncbi:hypothetical protein [Natronomonas sp. EA1]|uniref:hypothetical protein n=1 Tax=Natronomonas sp. EA1 TaxID=3421655 RepID=UPI003EB83F85